MKKRSGSPQLVAAFTLTEAMVALFIVAIAVVLLGATAGYLRGKGDQGVCLARMRQVGSALLLFVGEHGRVFPYSGETTTAPYATIWSGRLYHEGYLKDIDTFYCPAHPVSERPERSLLLKTPQNPWANISFGVNKFGLMPNNGYPTLQRRARLDEIRDPAKVLMLAESRELKQSAGGWYEFYPDFAAAADLTNENTIVTGRHQGYATLMFCDGHIEVAHVRNDLYRRTNYSRNPPWCSGVYTTR